MRTHQFPAIQNQLHAMSAFLEEFYPDYYAEHLRKRGRAGVAGCCINVMTELKLKVEALERALLDAHADLTNEQFEPKSDMPPIPGVDGKILRPITEPESHIMSNEYKPVFVFFAATDKKIEHYKWGNIEEIHDIDGQIELQVNVEGFSNSYPINRVYIKE